jgi:hypothetical protein
MSDNNPPTRRQVNCQNKGVHTCPKYDDSLKGTYAEVTECGSCGLWKPTVDFRLDRIERAVAENRALLHEIRNRLMIAFKPVVVAERKPNPRCMHYQASFCDKLIAGWDDKKGHPCDYCAYRPDEPEPEEEKHGAKTAKPIERSRGNCKVSIMCEQWHRGRTDYNHAPGDCDDCIGWYPSDDCKGGEALETYQHGRSPDNCRHNRCSGDCGWCPAWSPIEDGG